MAPSELSMEITILWRIVTVQIMQDGVPHHIENFDEIRWTV
jgi:hypothetical protein